jgi:prephenate dehydratase
VDGSLAGRRSRPEHVEAGEPPANDRPWEYVFWVDLDADATAFPTRQALDDLAGVTTSVRVLGSNARGARG